VILGVRINSDYTRSLWSLFCGFGQEQKLGARMYFLRPGAGGAGARAGGGHLLYFAGEDKYSQKIRLANKKMLQNTGPVTANIGWYLVSILHDRQSCSFNITWN
jgi:hypothetical protein